MKLCRSLQISACTNSLAKVTGAFSAGITLLLLVLLDVSSARAQVVLNVPPNPAPVSIGSETTLNLLPSGVLPLGFNAGAADNTSTNVIVNISGGQTSGQFSARGGSTLNVTSGSLGIILDVYSGATANISGGTSEGLFNAFSGSTINISGGSLGDIFLAQSASSLKLLGGDFRIDGVSVGGLSTPGNMLQTDIPLNSVLSATLADGTSVAFSSQDIDLFANGVLHLEAVALPTIGPATITASVDPVPLGIRQGQTLGVNTGGLVGDHFGAGWGSMVNVDGGTVGVNMEATGAVVSILSGIVGKSFDANFGSLVTIRGGSIGNDFDANKGSVVSILGGSVGNGFDANLGSQVTVSGGSLGDSFSANSGSQVHLRGTEFSVDGIELTGLPFGVAQTISSRDVELSGTLADGSLFSFDLSSTLVPTKDFFAVDALLTVTRISPFSADFDNDGDVDGDDLNLWELAFAASSSSADADNDGDSDGSDFLLWQSQYGSSVPASLGTVPEPSTLALGLIALVAAHGSRRRTRVIA